MMVIKVSSLSLYIFFSILYLYFSYALLCDAGTVHFFNHDSTDEFHKDIMYLPFSKEDTDRTKNGKEKVTHRDTTLGNQSPPQYLASTGSLVELPS